MTPKGIFGQEAAELKATKRKRKPGRVSALKANVLVIVGRTCNRSAADGSLCSLPRLKHRCYPVPYGYDAHAFVTPCVWHVAELAETNAALPPWTVQTQKDLEPLHRHLKDNWPYVIEKHQKEHQNDKTAR